MLLEAVYEQDFHQPRLVSVIPARRIQIKA
jgi:hypothetical protein